MSTRALKYNVIFFSFCIIMYIYCDGIFSVKYMCDITILMLCNEFEILRILVESCFSTIIITTIQKNCCFFIN